MAITKRLVKGSPLTAEEHDANIDALNRYQESYTNLAAIRAAIPNPEDGLWAYNTAGTLRFYAIDGSWESQSLTAGDTAVQPADIVGKLDKGGYSGTAQDLKDEIDSINFDGVKVYETLAQAQAVSPVPSDYTGFSIDPLTDSENGGQYYYLASEPDGTKFYRSFNCLSVDEFDNYRFQEFSVPVNRVVDPPFGIFAGGAYYSEFDNWFDGVARPLKEIIVGSGSNGQIGVALYEINGTTATQYSAKTLNVVDGVNTFSFQQITDVVPVLGTKYFIYIKDVSGNTLSGASNNTLKGRAINFVNTTNVLTNNFSFSFYLSFRKEVLLNYNDFNIVDECKSKDNVIVPPGTWNLTEAIVLRNNQSITGIKGQSFIKVDNSITDAFIIDSVNNVTLKDFDLIGGSNDVVMSGNDVAAGVVDDIDDAINLNGIGSNNGVKINNSESLTIQNINVSNFSGKGIEVENFGQFYQKSSKFSNVYTSNNYLGVSFVNKAEYITVTGLHSNRNQIGLQIDAGNNTFSGCDVSGNRVNVTILGGVNNAHGNITGGTYNHASLFGFLIDNIDAGQLITSANIWYAPIYVRNSKGIAFNSCQLAQTSLFADGNRSSGGVWAVNNCMIKNLTLNLNYNGNTSNVSLKNNLKMDGTDSSLYNN